MRICQGLLALMLAGLGPSLAQAAPCGREVVLPASLVASPLVLLGELHGTAQIPEFVQGYVCSLARVVDHVVLALEIPADEQPLLDAFLASEGRAADRRALLDSPFWSRPLQRQDGRSSRAMLALLDAVRQHNQDRPARAITVAAIADGDELRMSQNVRTLVSGAGAGRPRHVVVVIGELHAAKHKGHSFDPGFESLGYLLRDLAPVALRAEFGQGSAWACRRKDRCEAGAVGGTRGAPLDRPFSISLMPPERKPGFDGRYDVGVVEASEPAFLGPIP
ncbi:ChaN family lipoprotein [Pelomonas sp. CA6]|uniref:ChaN family lipoprotein n=1 Tax=Pelomonas sp. CA6 TaxID=2907999 RepID=UPI001F4AA238|nr:ChaN family lipoprotein [Pelomonas sp. CA6]MCH7342247.1 ChaN family lipoprotein [Pelomonas sp. CA6]